MITDVTHIGCAEQRIANDMDKHIGIAVSQQPKWVFYLDATQPKGSSGHEPMHVVAHSYSYLHTVYSCWSCVYLCEGYCQGSFIVASGARKINGGGKDP